MRRNAAYGLAFLIILCGISGDAQAARFSGKYLLHVCASDANGKELVEGGHIACQAYIAGVLDYNTLIQSLGTAPSVEFCVPDNVDMNLLQKQVYSYVYQTRKLHNSFIAAPAIALALHGYYPCKK